MIDDIKKILNNTPGLHMLFFFGVDEEQLTEIQSSAIGKIHHVHVVHNFIETSYKLENELRDQKVLLTFPFPKPEGREWIRFPLAGLYYANKELRLDEVGKFMEQYGLKPYQQKLVERYKKELLTKKNQERLVSILAPDRFDEMSLARGLISSLLEFSAVVTEELILSKILTISSDSKKLSDFIRKAENLELQNNVLKYFHHFLDDEINSLNEEKVALTGAKVKYNLITRHITKVDSNDSYGLLKYKNSTIKNRFLSVIQSWLDHPQLGKSFATTINELGPEIKAEKIVSWYGPIHDYGFLSKELLASIAKQLINDVQDKPLQTSQLIQPLLQKDIEQSWKATYTSMFHAAQMLQALDTYPHFDYNRPEDYLYEYQNEWYKVDFNYRKFILTYQQIPAEQDFSLVTLHKLVTERYESFLKQLNISWQKLITGKDLSFSSIKTNHQFNFYEKQVAANTSKLAVIISDAFRYEIGKELSDLLQQDTKNKVQLELGMASLPSVTAVGMTNLLPGKEINVSPTMGVTIDGQKTLTTENRTAILQARNPKSRAISYKEINRMTREDGRKLFIENSPIYIYHNVIDFEGDKQITEDNSFEAVERTLQELQKLIMKVYSWNVYHVVLTADHGFIYTHEFVKDDTLEDAPKGDHVLKVGSRYALINSSYKGKTEGYRLHLANTSMAKNEYDILLPRAVNRFRKAGSGNQYIHGGGSLQELLIPIIKYFRKKEGVSESVTIKLLTKNLRTTGSLKLNFLQVEAVSSDLKPLNVSIGLFNDDNSSISNIENVEFDSTSTNPTDRAKSIILSLNSRGSQLSQCQLKVFEVTDVSLLNPVLTSTVMIDTLMEKDEFQ